MNTTKIVITLLVIGSITALCTATETTWRHAGFEVYAYDINFTEYNATNVLKLDAKQVSNVIHANQYDTLQDAFNATSDGGKIIINGDHTVSAPVDIVSNPLDIEINGVLTLGNAVNDNMFYIGDAASTKPQGIRFHGNGILDGNRAQNTGGTQYQALIDMAYSRNSSIDGLEFRDFNHYAIRTIGYATAQQADDWSISGNQIINNLIHDGGSDVANNDAGVLVTSHASKGTLVQGNQIWNINGTGVLLEDYVPYSLVANNIVYNISMDGMKDLYGYGNQFMGNQIMNSSTGGGYSGILVSGRKTIIDSNRVAGTIAGIQVYNNNKSEFGTWNTITNNQVFDTGRPGTNGYGIIVQGTAVNKSEYNIVYGNVIANTSDNSLSYVQDSYTISDSFESQMYYGVYMQNAENNYVYNNVIDSTTSPVQGTTDNFAYNNYGVSPFNFGNNATAPTAFGAGDTYYNTTANIMYCYNGSAWNALY